MEERFVDPKLAKLLPISATIFDGILHLAGRSVKKL